MKDIFTKSLYQLATIVLTNNVVELDEKVYNQLLGKAVETKLPPAYANLFMAGLEKRFLKILTLNPVYGFDI